MKRTAWKSLLIFLLCAMFVLTGCTFFQNKPEENNSSEQILEELEAMKAQLEAAKNEIESMKSEDVGAVETAVPAPVAPPTPQIVVEETTVEVPVKVIVGLHCKVNGKSRVPVEGTTKVHAVADKQKGYEFDHWEINGEPVTDKGAEADFTFSDTATVCAIYHPRRILTCINCYFQFLDAKGKAKGAKKTEFDFEEKYKNPVTGKKCDGGKISGYITANVPKGKEIDYWLINGVKYEPPKTIQKFEIENLDEATTYEVVFKKSSSSTTDNKKQCNVLMENCTFSCKDKYYGAVKGTVPYGSKITITGRVSKNRAAYAYFTGNPFDAGKGSAGSPLKYTSYDENYYYFKYSYTVKSDVVVTFIPVYGAG